VGRSFKLHLPAAAKDDLGSHVPNFIDGRPSNASDLIEVDAMRSAAPMK